MVRCPIHFDKFPRKPGGTHWFPWVECGSERHESAEKAYLRSFPELSIQSLTRSELGHRVSHLQYQVKRSQIQIVNCACWIIMFFLFISIIGNCSTLQCCSDSLRKSWKIEDSTDQIQDQVRRISYCHGSQQKLQKTFILTLWCCEELLLEPSNWNVAGKLIGRLCK